ncbi:hypothetical protein C7B79_23325 [Chroococcidiopsis cubana CCALA 043]|nr:hypothetical protein C7B80_08375 [Cyanosarcina cf. burmensis CCALA 770]PSB61085.1 hypothetical protein C7B79_23325 [Chroococcidiopsis cubana CCALA 043]
MTLVLAAQAFLVVLRHQTEPLVNAHNNWTMPSNSNSLAQFNATRDSHSLESTTDAPMALQMTLSYSLAA